MEQYTTLVSIDRDTKTLNERIADANQRGWVVQEVKPFTGSLGYDLCLVLFSRSKVEQPQDEQPPAPEPMKMRS